MILISCTHHIQLFVDAFLSSIDSQADDITADGAVQQPVPLPPLNVQIEPLSLQKKMVATVCGDYFQKTLEEMEDLIGDAQGTHFPMPLEQLNVYCNEIGKKALCLMENVISDGMPVTGWDTDIRWKGKYFFRGKIREMLGITHDSLSGRLY